MTAPEKLLKQWVKRGELGTLKPRLRQVLLAQLLELEQQVLCPAQQAFSAACQSLPAPVAMALIGYQPHHLLGVVSHSTSNITCYPQLQQPITQPVALLSVTPNTLEAITTGIARGYLKNIQHLWLELSPSCWQKDHKARTRRLLTHLYNRFSSPVAQEEAPTQFYFIPLQATAAQWRLARQFKREFRSIKLPETLQAQPTWVNFLNTLKETVRTHNPLSMLRWPVIEDSMFVSYSSMAQAELDFLNTQPHWLARLAENTAGNPQRCPALASSSNNRIHQAYHLARFEQWAAIELKQLQAVVEFGAGYGNMAHLFARSGFQGDYVLFDFAFFNQLQQFYLNLVSLEEAKPAAFRAITLSELEALEQQVQHWQQQGVSLKHALFVATWSLSEAPLALRDRILACIKPFGYVLLAFQKQFEDIDNTAYFTQKGNELSEFHWSLEPMEHLGSSLYWFGKQKALF